MTVKNKLNAILALALTAFASLGFLSVRSAGNSDLISRDVLLVAGIAVGMVLTLIVWLVVRRLVLDPIDRLTEQAELAATKWLPAILTGIASSADATNVPTPRSIQKEADDEIGLLVDAINQFQSSSMNVVSGQGVIHRNTVDALVGHSRRNQQLNLVMQDLLSELAEQGHDGQLHRLSQLARRMYRNEESLLALAGDSVPREWSRPVAIEEVVRSAIGEIELSSQIAVGDLPDKFMHGSVVDDVGHILVQLLDNAINHSDGMVVTVSARTVPQGIAMEVANRGQGIAKQELKVLNECISNPPDLGDAQLGDIGLAAAGRLAQRHEIEIHLASTPGAGSTAIVILPLLIFPDGVVNRSTVVRPPSILGQPGSAELKEVRSASKVMESMDADLDVEAELDIERDALQEPGLIQLRNLHLAHDEHLTDRSQPVQAWNPDATHDGFPADATVPTMDEMNEVVMSFATATIDPLVGLSVSADGNDSPPASPSAFAEFASGVGRGLVDFANEAKPQNLREGSNG